MTGLPRLALALLAASALCVVTLEVRTHETGDPYYRFLVWNLMLAWVPVALAAAAYGRARRRVDAVVAVLLVLWLLFFPNAPYLLTDFIHLKPRPGVPMWFDAAMLASFAATGWLLGLLSLEVWKRLLEERVGRVGAWLGVALVSVLCGYGIYLGRVERWNSWDVLMEPRPFFAAIRAHLREPWENPQLLGITALFTVLVLLSYYAFEQLRRWRHPKDAQA